MRPAERGDPARIGAAAAYVPTRPGAEVARPGGRGGAGGILGRLAGAFTLPESLRGARWVPSRGAVGGVLLLAILTIGVFGLRVAWARSSAAPAPIVPATSTVAALGSASPSASVGPSAVAASVGASAEGSAPAAGPALVVHVVGQVKRPGIVELPPGSRVVDAVDAAGGPTRRADLSAVNLARLAVDGEQIRVPRPGEAVPGGGPAAAGSGSAVGGPVSLNGADAAALDSLPGIGPVLAQRILDWRSEHGRFTSIDELGEVSGIGEKLLALLAPRVTL